MMDRLDPKRLSIPNVRGKKGPLIQQAPRPKPQEKFLKGPIPWGWITKAAKQPGKALHLATALWFLAGVKRNRKIVLSNATLRALGVNRHAGYRGLNALEKIGLVSVERHAGRNPTVTILENKNKDRTSSSSEDP